MTAEENKTSDKKNFTRLLDTDEAKVPQVGDTVKGIVVSASKAEVKLDIDGIFMGIVRGPELTGGGDDYFNLKPGDEIEATVISEENENGELELSFKYAGEAKAKANLKEAYENRTAVKIKIIGANRGGLMVSFGQLGGFLPVSQLSPENYPRVSGGDKSKILEKLKSFIGKEIEARVINFDETGQEEKIIFSEKEVWSEKQKDIISKYKAGTVVEGVITAVTDFGVFVSFGEKLEGLIHISELAWQRIDDPTELFKVGGKIKAEVIGVDGSKIFLSSKKLLKDPWEEVEKKYKVGQPVRGVVLKVNPFGLFVKLDDDIHGLAHVSQLGLAPGQKAGDIFKAGEERSFIVASIEPKEHRLGLAPVKNEEGEAKGGTKEKEESKEGKEKAKEVKKEKKAKPVKANKEEKAKGEAKSKKS